MISSRFVCVWNVHDDFLSWFVVVVAFTRNFSFFKSWMCIYFTVRRGGDFWAKNIYCGGNEAPIKGRKVGRLMWE